MYQAVTDIHICFLGCGNICEKHAKGLGKLGTKISFASRSEEKAKQFQQKFKGQKAFGSYDQVFADADINTVFITTPPDSHLELTEKALKAGKHVIVEKPPFYTSEDMEKMGQLAENRDLQLLVAENYFYRPMRKQVADLLASGVIGKPLFVNINATKKQDSKDDWREDVAISKHGALFEGGIHWVNFINNIGLNFKEVKGFIPNEKKALERSIQLTALSDSGTVVNLFYSWDVDTLLFGLRHSKIHGTEGSITFESNGVFLFVRGRKWKFKLPNFAKITGFGPMYKDFLSALQSGNSPAFTWQMAKKDLEVIEQTYGSAI